MLKRTDLIMGFRTDEKVVDFIDNDAVYIPKTKKTLNLDEIMVEVERDEMYDFIKAGKQAGSVNPKEFITWRDFMTYFTDY